jgi:CHAT domain-containing protein
MSVPESATIQAKLPADTALIEFVVGEDDTIVFAMTRDHFVSRLAPIDRTNLRTKVRLVRELVRRQDRDDWRHAAASLADTLLEPVLASDRLESVRRLILVPHDVLHYLPFSLLPREDGGRLLIEGFDLSYLPAAGTLVLADAGGRGAGAGVLAVAPAIARLRYSADEALAIAATIDGPSRVLVGGDATERAFKELASGFGTIHLATHNLWNPLNPLLSALELEPGGGEDGRLEVHEIFDLDLDAGLVTLSACETALGTGYRGAAPVGDDFVGLTRAFLHAGTGAVVASLWDVDDRSTLELMERFYARIGASDRPAAALAAAQREMLATGELAAYRWAPFIVIGGKAAK